MRYVSYAESLNEQEHVAMLSWFKRRTLARKTPMSHANLPQRLQGSRLGTKHVGTLAWDSGRSSRLVTISADGRSASWPRQSTDTLDLDYFSACVPTRLHLHGGRYSWEVIIEELASTQISVGFMLVWDVGPDWGGLGYVGSSATSWSYDAATGNVVTDVQIVQDGLPILLDRPSGVVTVEVMLPASAHGQAMFKVDGVRSEPIVLPPDAVVMPAVSLHAHGQCVTLRESRSTISSESDSIGWTQPPVSAPPIVWKVVAYDSFEASSYPQNADSAFYALASYCTEEEARRRASEAVIRQNPQAIADHVFIVSSDGQRFDATLSVCKSCDERGSLVWSGRDLHPARQYRGTCSTCGASDDYGASDVTFVEPR